MAEYIEKQTMLEDFESCNRSSPEWTPQRVKTLIVRQPPADAVTALYGEWIYDCDTDEPRCSECGEDALEGVITPYCPHCGAKMDEEDENNGTHQ